MHPDTYPPSAQGDPALASLWETMLRAYRDLDIAEQRGLNVTARDRLLEKYLHTYRAYCDAERRVPVCCPPLPLVVQQTAFGWETRDVH